MKAILLSLILCCCTAHAQTASDWTHVERLRGGTQLMVTTWRTVPCTLSYASSDGMECVFRGRVYWVERTRIQQISLEKHGHSALIGAALGAAVVGSLVAARDSGDDPDKGVRVLVEGGLGALVGSFFGHFARSSEGQVVYLAGAASP